MKHETCPNCGYTQAERQIVRDNATDAPVGEQLFCPSCRHYEHPTPPESTGILESALTKLRNLGLSDDEIEAVTGKKSERSDNSDSTDGPTPPRPENTTKG